MKFGDDVFEMEGKNKFRWNDNLSNSAPTEFGGYPVRKVAQATWCKDRCEEADIYQFVFGVLGSVEIAHWKGFLYVQVTGSVTGDDFKDATGLLGKREVDAFIGRDGVEMDDVNEFGQSWQVGDKDPKLFMTEYQSEKRCILPEKTKRRLSIGTRRMAVDACSHLSGELQNMCRFDVEATGDRLMSYSPLFAVL